MALHVKKGDTVEIIAGDHKGVTGKVLQVNPTRHTVLIQGHNLVKKHVRPSRRNPQGGRINVEQPIHMSNVLPVNPKSSKGSRVKFMKDRKGRKVRQATDGTEIDVVTRAQS